jgi:hypothetical protein
MANKSEAARLWRMICEKDRELCELVKDCRTGPTPAYTKAKRDMVKLKAEYEKANGTGAMDPTSIAHGEAMTRNKVLGDRMGYTGEDTTHGVDEGLPR